MIVALQIHTPAIDAETAVVCLDSVHDVGVVVLSAGSDLVELAQDLVHDLDATRTISDINDTGTTFLGKDKFDELPTEII